MNDDVVINELQLPRGLLAAIRAGQWKPPTDISRWHSLFPVEDVRRPSLYSLDRIKVENEGWLMETDPAWLGRPSKDQQPGDIDPRRSLLIADLQPDAVIALDYRESSNRPSVVFLTTGEPSYWIKVAPDIESFIQTLSL